MILFEIKNYISKRSNLNFCLYRRKILQKKFGLVMKVKLFFFLKKEKVVTVKPDADFSPLEFLIQQLLVYSATRNQRSNETKRDNGCQNNQHIFDRKNHRIGQRWSNHYQFKMLL